MTTFLTIDRIRTLGINGAESSGKHGLSEQKPLNGIKKVRKKIITLFGKRVTFARIMLLFVEKIRIISNYVENFDTEYSLSLLYTLF